MVVYKVNVTERTTPLSMGVVLLFALKFQSDSIMFSKL